MNRRQFLKGLAATVVAVALPRARAVGEAPPIEEEHGDRYTLVFRGDATRESCPDGRGYRVTELSVWIDVPGKGWVVIPGWEGSAFTWEVT